MRLIGFKSQLLSNYKSKMNATYQFKTICLLFLMGGMSILLGLGFWMGLALITDNVQPPPQEIWIMFTLAGGLLTFIFGSLYGRTQWKIQHHAWLKQHGQLIATTFRGTAVAALMGTNGLVLPWKVFSDWTDPQTQIQYTLASEAMFSNTLKNYTTQQPVMVYIQPNNPKDYYVDLEPVQAFIFEQIK